MEEQAELQEKIDAGDALGHRLQDRDGHGRAALPARRRRCRPSSPAASAAAWRSAGCCCRARPAAAGRADQPSRRRDRWPGCSATWRTIPARDRASPTTATSSTRSPAGSSSSIAASGIPYEGNYSGLAGAEAEARRARKAGGRGAPAHPGARAGMDRGIARRRARPSPRRASRLRGAGRAGAARRTRTTAQIVIPPGPRSAERRRGRAGSRRTTATSSCSRI